MPSIQIPVDVGNEAFECPTCGFPAQQHRYQCSVSKFPPMSNGEPLRNPFHDKRNSPRMSGQMGHVACTVCEVCGFIALWIGDNLIFPTYPKNIKKPSADMPQEIKEIYVEAAEVAHRSPRGAAALLRLCLEMLLKYLKISGENLNKMIGNSRFPEKILKACDVVRVHGNDAVHPREIQLDDKAETVSTLFYLINYIVEMQITLPNKVDEVFDSLTEEQKKHIEKRNKNDKSS